MGYQRRVHGDKLPNLQANMKSFAVFAAVVGSALCAPAADPAYLAYGHLAAPYAGHLGYAATHLGYAGLHAAVAAPATVEVKSVEVEPATVEVAAPVVYNAAHVVAPAVHAVAPAVATVPVVQYGLQHTVQHVPQVHVQKHVSTHTTHHVINHAPVVGSYLHGLPVATTAVVAEAAEAAPVEEA